MAVPANPCEVAQQRALVSRHPLEIRHRIPTEWYHQLFAALLCLGAIGQSVEAAAVNLAWNPNPEPDIAGYLISYGTSPGNYSSTQATGNVTSATLSGLQEGQTYYFSLKAVNTAGLQSASSAEVSQYVELAAPVNQAPVAIGQTVITDKYTAVPITLAASDANGDALVYTIVNAPSMGSLSGTAPNLTYTPRGSGTDQFQFAVSDGAFTSNLGTVSITISEQPIELTSQILDRSLTSIHS
ncbi:MAG: Ig-like domain-containing protein, partial [Akkermansiaceae bacterium]|nr:Ig-like domain-containing protein [Akkermansiaceae bacterium]